MCVGGEKTPKGTANTGGRQHGKHVMKNQEPAYVDPIMQDKVNDEDHQNYVGGVFEIEGGLNTVQKPEWVKIEVVMDSGAAESVAPADLVPWVPVQESAGSKAGRKYLSASGEVLSNLGEKKIEVFTNEGQLSDRRRHQTPLQHRTCV